MLLLIHLALQCCHSCEWKVHCRLAPTKYLFLCILSVVFFGYPVIWKILMYKWFCWLWQGEEWNCTCSCVIPAWHPLSLGHFFFCFLMTVADWAWLGFDVIIDWNILVTSDIGGRTGSIRFQVRISYIISVNLDSRDCRGSIICVNGGYHSLTEFKSAGVSWDEFLFFYT